MFNRQQNLSRALKVYGQKNAQRQVNPAPRKAKVNDTTHYLAFVATGLGGIAQLVDGSTKKEVGVTSFDGNILNNGRDVIIDAIRMLGTGKQADSDVKRANWFDKDVIPAELLNAELRLVQNSDVLISIPVSDIINFNSDDFRSISTTPVMKAKEEFKWELEFPKGVVVPKTAERSFLCRIEVRCTEVKA